MIQVAPLIHSLVKQIVTVESVNLVSSFEGMLLLFLVHIPLYLNGSGRIENCSLVYLADLTFRFSIMECQKQQKSVQLMGLLSRTHTHILKNVPKINSKIDPKLVLGNGIKNVPRIALCKNIL